MLTRAETITTQRSIPCGEQAYPVILARSNAHDGTGSALCQGLWLMHTATLLYREDGENPKAAIQVCASDDVMSVCAYSTM